jgi:hypothetical protein
MIAALKQAIAIYQAIGMGRVRPPLVEFTTAGEIIAAGGNGSASQ